MWKVTKRTIPYGIQFHDGNDWFILNSKLSKYIVNTSDDFLNNLKKMFNHHIMPLEVFHSFEYLYLLNLDNL